MPGKRALVIVAWICLASLMLVGPAKAQQPPIREVVDDDLDRAIDRTVRYIYGRQLANGHWPHDYRTPAAGATALSLFALLDAGQKPGLEQIQKGIDALVATDTKHLYVRCLRAMVLAQVGVNRMTDKQKATFQADMEYLTRNAAAHGAWEYGGPDRTGDNSCSQFALLALWEAIRAKENVRLDLIRAVERTWVSRQKKGEQEGGWTYAGTVGTKGDATCSMTAAGVASMFICQDLLIGGTCKPYANRKVIEDGVKWLGDNLKENYIKDGYLAFCVQRVGLASGLKMLGKMDWYAVGARELAKPQPYGPRYEGQWGPDVRAGFELIFLARGRIPLVFNKLDLGPRSGWDAHPRDIAQFAEYMRRTFESKMRWQVVSIADDMRLLLDAPILLVTGTEPLALTEGDWAKLKEYSLRGGMLLFVPVHGHVPFKDAVSAKLATLYAEQNKDAPKHYELKQVPRDDPIFSTYAPISDRDKNALVFWGVHDGTRWLALLSGADCSCNWQRLQGQGGHLDLGTNLFIYATGGNDMGSRMRPVFVGADQPVRGTVKVGWVRHGGNWNTQPYALDYLGQKLAAENRLGMDLTRGVDVGRDNLAAFRLLWITGADAFEFSPAEVAALRKYLDDNGTIFINAVTGSAEFAESADKLVDALASGREGARIYPDPESPIMTGKLGAHRGLPIDKPQTAKNNQKEKVQLTASPMVLYVEGEHPRIITARNGIHETLDGHTAWSTAGYMPAYSGQVAANIVLYALMDRPKPPVPAPPPPQTAPEPATQPATAPADAG